MNRKPPYGYWNIKKNVINDAKSYKKRTEWKYSSPGAYGSARRNNWLDDCRKHIKSTFKEERGYWKNKKRVFKDAKKYKTRADWAKNSAIAYKSARVNGWLEISCKHMVLKMGRWLIKKNVINDAKKYKTRTEWAKNSGAAYQSARVHGWLEKACKHMAKSSLKSQN
jgi:hypothetical protein